MDTVSPVEEPSEPSENDQEQVVSSLEMVKYPAYSVLARKGVTSDAIHDQDATFEQLGIEDSILRGLHSVGYERPSPIQALAIPVALQGRSLVLQSKAGTGKSCVIAVVALQRVNVSIEAPQVLILTSSSEISIQLFYTIMEIGKYKEGVTCRYAIGGTNLDQDIKYLSQCHIIVGTIGRVCQIVTENAVKVDLIKLLLLDEVDKLQEDTMITSFNWLYNRLRPGRQIITLSATYPANIKRHILPYMINPKSIRLNVDSCELEGVMPYVLINHNQLQNVMQAKVDALCWLLKNVAFKQCIVFSNFHARVHELVEELKNAGFSVQSFTGSMALCDRLRTLKIIRKEEVKIIVSTDLLCRGVDLPNVDLVVNFDVPDSFVIYLHRLGRCGRFGSYGAAVTLLSYKKDASAFCQMVLQHGLKFKVLNSKPPADLTSNVEAYEKFPAFIHDQSAANYAWPLLLTMNLKITQHVNTRPPQSTSTTTTTTTVSDGKPKKPTKAKQQPQRNCQSDVEEFLCKFSRFESDPLEENGKPDQRVYAEQTFRSILANLLNNDFPEVSLLTTKVPRCFFGPLSAALDKEKTDQHNGQATGTNGAQSTAEGTVDSVNNGLPESADSYSKLNGFPSEPLVGDEEECVQPTLDKQSAEVGQTTPVDNCNQQVAVVVADSSSQTLPVKKESQRSVAYQEQLELWTKHMELYEQLLGQYRTLLEKISSSSTECGTQNGQPDAVDHHEDVQFYDDYLKQYIAYMMSFNQMTTR